MLDAHLITDKLKGIVLSCGEINESSVLEYKLKPHDTTKHECEFFKDIISLLNSADRPDEDRFLLYGVEDKQRLALGYDFGTSLDEADYQNLFDKITPRPTIEFHAIDASQILDKFEPDKMQFACFYIPAINFGKIYELKISVCDADFSNKKKYRRYEAGVSFTREGSRVRPLVQADRDRMRATKLQPSLETVDGLPPSFDSNGLSTFALAAILGSWDEGNANDRDAIEMASGKSYDDWVSPLREQAFADPRNFLLNGKTWTIIQRETLLSHYGNNISPALIDNLKPTIAGILCSTDAKFDLDPNERFAAAIYGKGPVFSQHLRKGLAGFLAIAGTESADLPKCSSAYIDGLIFDLESRVLLADDWKVLASASEILPLFSEASPDSYLILVERALENGSGLSEYLSQEEGSFIGRRYGSGLFLGIQYAARVAEHFARSMSLLLKLHQLSPLAGLAIEKILLPWLPQTTASVSARSSMGANLIEADCWESLLNLLPNVTTAGSRIPQPTYLATEYLPDNVSLSEFWAVSRAYVEAAIEGSHGSLERSRDLIRNFHSIIGAECIGKFMKQMEKTCSNLSDMDSFKLWGDLKNYVSGCEKYSDAAWVPNDESLGVISATLETIRPVGSFFDALYLFAYDDFELTDGADWQKGEKELQEARVQALERIYEERSWQGIADLVSDCVNKAIIGACCAKASFEIDVREAMFAHLAELGGIGQVAEAFACESYVIHGDINLAIPESSNWPMARSIAFFVSLPCKKAVWEVAERVLGNKSSSYWQKARSCRMVDTAEEANHVLSKYNEAGRCADSILLAHTCIENELAIDHKLLLESLDKYSPGNGNGFETHFIMEVCKYVEGKLPSIDLAWQEFRIFPLLGRERKNIYLFKLMSLEPEFFISILSLAYRSKKSEPQDEKAMENAARRAHDVLWQWREVPGQTPSGLDEARFGLWVKEAMELAKDVELADIAESIVGQCLFHAPQDPGGLFINRTVADCLNHSAHMLNGYSCEAVNSRSPISIDGTGAVHYAAAQEYTKRAEQLENIGLLDFAALSRQISSNFKADGDREKAGDI